VHSSERASELLFCFPERSALQAVSMSDTNLFLIGNNGASESFSRDNVSQQSSCLPFSILHPRRLSRMQFLPSPNSSLSTDMIFFFSLVGFTSLLQICLERIFPKSGVPFRAPRE
jgi:hypothetical protein